MTEPVQYREHESGPPSFSMDKSKEVHVRCKVEFIHRVIHHEEAPTATQNVIKTLELVVQQLVIDNPKFDVKKIDECFYGMINELTYKQPLKCMKSMKALKDSKLEASAKAILDTSGLVIRRPNTRKAHTKEKTRVEKLKEKYSYVDVELTDEGLIELDDYMSGFKMD